MGNDTRSDFRLFKKSGRYILCFNGSEDEIPVKVVWVRPLSGSGKEVAFVDEKKKEVATVDGLEHLDLDSRTVAEEALEQRYLAAKIGRVYSTKVHFGICFWDVETDRGRRAFAMKDSYKNVIRMRGDRLVIRDTIGNRYEIGSLAALDPQSRLQVEKVL